MQDDDREKNLILGVLAGIGIGAIVGAVAGLLFAPQAGTDTRGKIGGQLQGFGTRLTDLTDEVATRVRSAVNAGRQAAVDAGAEEGGDRMSS